MKKTTFLLLVSSFIIGTILYTWIDDVEPVITYFPIDESATFSQAYTELRTDKDTSDSLNVTWDSLSESTESFYLRQDISLLYKNGFFKGILNKWRENERIITLSHTLPVHNNGLLQAISLHFGEIHNQDEIKSIHKMSYNDLSIDKITENKNQTQINKSLRENWYGLLTHFNIDHTAYHIVPLIDLHLYNEQTIPLLSKEKTNKVLGQLWEGLYKNYVIPILEQQDNVLPHVMPLILFDKHAKHLLVLFEWNGEKIKLLQQY